MIDLHNNIKVSRAISPVVVSDTTAKVSQIIDTAGYASLELVIVTSDLLDTDATFAVLIEDGNDSGLSDNAAVADTDLLGTESGASFLFSDDNETRKIGYMGGKRYVRATITPAANTAAALFGAVWVQGNARKKFDTSQG